MEEKPNNAEQPNQQQNIQDTKDAVKDGANLAKNVASGNYLGAIKDGLKLLENKKVRKTILIAVLIPIIVIVAIAGSLFAIFDKVGSGIQSIVDGILNFFTINNKDWDGSITISDEQIDQIIEGIEDMGFDMDDLYLMGDIDYNTFDKESEEYKETIRKYIRKFFEAQATTETPYANLGEKNGKTYGSVYIYRMDEKGTSTILTYMNYSNEDRTDGMIKYDGKIVSESELKKIKKYFSIDDNGDLVIPAWSKIDETTTVNLKHINYKNIISQYTTPMNFYIYLAMIVQNPEFVSAVTELVKDSKINITLFDNVNEITEKETYSYTENEKGTIVVTLQGRDVIHQVDTSYSQTKETTTKTSMTNPIPQITYVKTWFCEQTVEYVIDDTGWKEQVPTILNKDNDESLKDEQGPTEDGEIPKNEVVTWKTNQQIVTEISTRTVTYKESTRSDVIDKTGNKGDQGVKNVDSKRRVPSNYKIDENTTFLGLMDDYFKIPNTNHYEAVAKTNLVTGAEWLFGLLQKDARLQTLEQIMRYIMYKYTGQDYGVTELDWKMFEIEKFTTINKGGSSAQLKRYIRYWENAGGPPTNGDNYIIEDDGVGHPTVGYGVDIENSGYKQKFIDAGYSTEIGGEVPIAFVDAIEDEILKNSRNSVEALISGLNLKEYQINALVSRAYNCGVAGAVSTLRGSPARNFVDSYNAYWNAETDDLYEINPDATTGNFEHSLYKQYMCKPTTSKGKELSGLVTRRKSEWTLFQTGYYDVLNERHAAFSGTTVKTSGYEFPHYLQRDFPGVYGTSTIPASGCGPTSLAMILAGLLKDPSITPWTVVENIADYWPDGSYYVAGVGSSHCIFNNDFLNKYYGVTSEVSYPSEEKVIQALEEGCGVIGGEEGHILAIIPVTAEEKAQGYKFHILDSARGHSGPYKSVADANKVVKGSLTFTAIIRP